ncbi:MAG: hypothetical protein JJT82_04380 [Legionellaceae bacterium]|nr:hypothetical protein [Legionellaceae bacterium]
MNSKIWQASTFSALLSALVFLTALLYQSVAEAQSQTGTRPNAVLVAPNVITQNIELAHRGHHRYHHPDRHQWREPGWRHRGGTYWTGWVRYSRYCARNCKIDRRSGRVIYCQNRCR